MASKFIPKCIQKSLESYTRSDIPKDDCLNLSNKLSHQYASNMLDKDNKHLHALYKELEEFEDFWKGVVFLFCVELPWWQADLKFTNSEHINHAKHIINSLKRTQKAITQDPDLWFNIQMQWESNLRQLGLPSSSFKEVNLLEDGISKEHKLNPDIQLTKQIDLLIDYVNGIMPQVAETNKSVTQIYKDDVHIQYAVRALYKIVSQSNVSKRKAVRVIDCLVSHIMKDHSINEDRIRKLIKG